MYIDTLKVGGKRNTQKACKKQVNFSKTTGGKFFKVGGNNNFRETEGNVPNRVEF